MNRTLLVRIIAGILVLVLALGLIVTPAMAAESGVTIQLHYNRPDGAYADWSVWFWVEGGEAADVPLSEENGSMVAEFPVPAGATSVGFIVKQPNWAAKDVDKDQFIDVAQYLSGAVHVYVESGVEGYRLEADSNVTTGIKVKEAVYKSGEGIQVSVTEALADAKTAFTVTGAQGDVAIASVSDNGGNVYLIIPEEDLDPMASYHLTCAGAQYAIRMPSVYSTADFEAKYTYEGDDLGAVWTAEKTTFRLWAPTAAAVTVNLYQTGTVGVEENPEQLEMQPDVNGTWVAEKSGKLNGTYYT